MNEGERLSVKNLQISQWQLKMKFSSEMRDAEFAQL